MSPSSAECPHCFRQPRSGWTLLEILMVMAIIAILMGITFGVSTGVRKRVAVGKAKVELSVIATALEAYRNQYGDYPWIPSSMPSGISSDEEVLFNALAGKLGPKGALINGRVFLEPARMHLENGNLTDPDAATAVANEYVDPWGQPYRYRYKVEGSEGLWLAPSFRLFSIGVDGQSDGPTSSGSIDFAHEDNIDNIYAGRD